MADIDKFSGFSKETFKFLKGLEKNNTKEWFEERRQIYEVSVLQPSLSFVSEMGEKLIKLAPQVVAIPKIDKSVFRIYKDVRFSKDKTPYKTHIGIFFWEGKRKKLENPGYYLQLNKSSIFLAGGFYYIPKDLLKPYRDAVVDPRKGTELRKIINRISKNAQYSVSGDKYKRVPAGYDQDHKNSDLLLFKGVHAYCEMPLPKEIYSSDFTQLCFKIFKDFAPLHKWMREYVR